MTKNLTKINTDKKIWDQNNSLPEEAFTPQKRTSSTSEHENFLIFSTFVGHFLALRIH
jgi:hypothetical protein